MSKLDIKQPGSLARVDSHVDYKVEATDERDKAASPTSLGRSTYPYAPLNSERLEIRLLTIVAGQGSTLIRARIQHQSLKQQPSYETVSYCWGDSNHRGSLELDERLVSIPKSSEDALRRLRLEDEDRVVWMDAVCIDQNNLEERSEQVRLMGEIYQGASNNLIYLGDAHLSKALASVRLLLDEIALETDDYARFKDIMYNEDGYRCSDAKLRVRVDQDALALLFRLPWFRRVWVVQEAVLAKRNICYCGDTEFDLLDAIRVSAWLVFKRRSVRANLLDCCRRASDLFDVVDHKYGFYASRNLETHQMLLLARNLDCSVDLDKVYGIWGCLAKRGSTIPDRLSISYTTSRAQIYAAAATLSIQEQSSLKILQHVFHSYDPYAQPSELPSWVPRFHEQYDDELHPCDLSPIHNACGAEGSEKMYSAKDEQVGSLTLETTGYTVDVIAESTRPATGETLRVLDFLQDFVTTVEYLSTETSYGKGDVAGGPLAISALIYTLLAGIDLNGDPISDANPETWTLYREHVLQGKDIVDPRNLDDTADHETRSFANFHAALVDACMHRKVFVTQQGHIGLGPAVLEPGDFAVVLNGLQWPAVVRPIGDGNFRFLGVSYVHSIMDGGWMECQRERARNEEAFVLV